MLSPNARNFVRVICGTGAVTVTAKLHDALACTASVAVQRTVVAPIGNIDADAGVQLVCTGATPPLATGALNVTATAAPFGDDAAWLAGHASVSAGRGSLTGGLGAGVRVGEVGDEHAHANSQDAINTACGQRLTRTARVCGLCTRSRFYRA
jgi:hypothetical protein